MKYTYYGHSSFMVEIDGVRIVFDPYISPNELAKAVDVNSIKCDYVMLSHGHFDHVADAELITRNNDATIISNFEIATYFGGKKLKYHPMNVGGQWDFGKFKVKLVNAVHSSVLPDGTYGGASVGFVVSGEGKSFYYSGDTALHLDMQLIGTYQKLERALLCVGDNFTMGIEDALIAAEFVKCNNITAMHIDTFPYIRIDHIRSVEKFAKAGMTLTLPEIGKTYDM